MKAAVYNNNGNLELVDYPIREIRDDELLIKVKCAGVCGTDFHIIEGNAYAERNRIIGHEYSGIIENKGKECKVFEIGDHVTVDPNIYCGYCIYCNSGKPNLCKNLSALGINLDGGFSEYSIVPEKQVKKINGNDYSSSAFAEPLSCCLRGIEQNNICIGDVVTIVGMGSIGLSMIQLVKRAGASKIIAIDPFERKLSIAEKLGADFLIDPTKSDVTESILGNFENGVDRIIDCVGKSSILNEAVNYIKSGGRITLFGVPESNDSMNVNLHNFFHKEVTINSSLINPFTFDSAVDLINDNQISFDEYGIEYLGLSDLPKLMSCKKDPEIIKYQIMF